MMNRRKEMGIKRRGCGDAYDFLHGKMVIFGKDINRGSNGRLQEQDMLRQAQLLDCCIKKGGMSGWEEEMDCSRNTIYE